MAEYRKLAYFGRMISTAFPRISSSRLRPDTTSPRPPALAAGAHSGATITTYTAHLPRCRSSRPRRSPPGGSPMLQPCPTPAFRCLMQYSGLDAHAERERVDRHRPDEGIAGAGAIPGRHISLIGHLCFTHLFH